AGFGDRPRSPSMSVMRHSSLGLQWESTGRPPSKRRPRLHWHQDGRGGLPLQDSCRGPTRSRSWMWCRGWLAVGTVGRWVGYTAMIELRPVRRGSEAQIRVRAAEARERVYEHRDRLVWFDRFGDGGLAGHWRGDCTAAASGWCDGRPQSSRYRKHRGGC